MHWALGAEEMGRAYERNESRSSEKSRLESSYSTPGIQHFEDFRVHNFNATTPPQLQVPILETHQPIAATAGQAALPRNLSADLDGSASSIIGKNGEANLTVEGKRQVSPRVLLSR